MLAYLDDIIAYEFGNTVQDHIVVIVRQVSPLIYDVKHYFKRKFRTRRVHIQMLKPRFTLPRRLETQTDLYNTVTLHDIGPYD